MNKSGEGDESNGKRKEEKQAQTVKKKIRKVNLRTKKWRKVEIVLPSPSFR